MNKVDEKEQSLGKGKPKDGKQNFRKGKKFPKHISQYREENNQKGRNDPAWYFKYPELAKLASRIAFNRRNGDAVGAVYGAASINKNMDPLMSVYYMLTPGKSAAADSAINVTSYAAWKMLNRRFRGVSKYQQSDFGIIQFGILDFMSSLAEAERIYGILNYYSLNNKQLPNKLLIALGVDPFSFVDLADYRLRLNRLILNAKTLCLVKGYGLLDHALLLASNVFKDKDNARAQLFGFVKAGYWRFDGTMSTGSALKFFRYSTDTKLTFSNAAGTFTTHLRTQETILADLQSQLQALLTDDDVDNVCSDILAFYGNKEDAAEVVTLSLVPEDYIVQPVFSDSVSRQFHNATCICGDYINTVPAALANDLLEDYSTVIPGTLATDGGVYVFQENNIIKFNLVHSAGNKHIIGYGGIYYKAGESDVAYRAVVKPIIDTDILSPTEEDIMEMTRLTYTTETQQSVVDGGATCYYMGIDMTPSVFMMNIQIFEFSQDAVIYTASAGVGYNHEITAISLLGYYISTVFRTPYSDREGLISKYDWAPTRVGNTNGVLSVLSDLDNYIAIDKEVLSQMHEIALISEFKNPISDFLIKE